MSPHRLTALQRRIAAVVLLVLVLVVMLMALTWPVVERYRHYSQAIGELEFRLRRLQTVAASRAPLEAQIEVLRQQGSLEKYYLPAGAPALVSADLQQQVSRLVGKYGGEMRRTQVLPVQQVEQDFNRLGIRVELTGDVATLRGLLYELESNIPVLILDNVQVRPTYQRLRRIRGRAENQGQLTISFDLIGFAQATGS